MEQNSRHAPIELAIQFMVPSPFTVDFAGPFMGQHFLIMMIALNI